MAAWGAGLAPSGDRGLMRGGEMTGVKKRYLQMNEDLLREHPEFLDPAAPSLPARLASVAAAMPSLAAAAAAKAIAEWGRPAGDITHLVFSTSTSAQVPAIDLRIASLLRLSDTVKRTTIAFQACTGTSSALRVAMDIAENNRVARILVICADMLSINGFHVPNEAHPAGIIAHALFSDGAGTVIVGAEPQEPVELPIFEMLSTSQVTIPGTEHVASTQFTTGGIDYSLLPDELVALIDRNVERCLDGALVPLGIAKLGWNNLFWVVHPGGPVIMDSLEAALKLEPEKLAASRQVLSEYGNMTGPTLIFVLDEVIRRHRQLDGDEEWGVMVSFGPGFTIEVMALHACSSNKR
ncbi:hypothetical protein PR202_gb13315 [Eleusine coracana subsp. coracana]|uniref:Chalcone synthase n=1 Tax=Eleusine coracana subsp. coracana TaxID=191504 RepID=A0AAV5EPY4_ELECO|nr:hypothetical protein PR202_gb13315 [Eleusine coracana subsp. coracana]